jgi:hypothetical protein
MAVAGCCASAIPAAAATLPDCAGTVEVAAAPIVRAERNGVLVVSDGRAAKLEGILLPQGVRDRAPGFLADQAVSTLNDFARGHSATFAVHVPKEDRYGRIRAQVFFSDLDEPWLQIAMLRRGLARVNIAADRPECANELYAAESEARDKHFGIWAAPAYGVRTPQTVLRDGGTFQVVEGRILTVVTRDGRSYLNFGANWQKDFTATISPENMANFRNLYLAPADYQGKLVRVRGFVDLQNGPHIDIATPQAIELVAEPPIRPAMP